jgi:hypothetical protein
VTSGGRKKKGVGVVLKKRNTREEDSWGLSQVRKERVASRVFHPPI